MFSSEKYFKPKAENRKFHHPFNSNLQVQINAQVKFNSIIVMETGDFKQSNKSSSSQCKIFGWTASQSGGIRHSVTMVTNCPCQKHYSDYITVYSFIM